MYVTLLADKNCSKGFIGVQVCYTLYYDIFIFIAVEICPLALIYIPKNLWVP